MNDTPQDEPQALPAVNVPEWLTATAPYIPQLLTALKFGVDTMKLADFIDQNLPLRLISEMCEDPERTVGILATAEPELSPFRGKLISVLSAVAPAEDDGEDEETSELELEEASE